MPLAVNGTVATPNELSPVTIVTGVPDAPVAGAVKVTFTPPTPPDTTLPN
jgi:hypothetical protein